MSRRLFFIILNTRYGCQTLDMQPGPGWTWDFDGRIVRDPFDDGPGIYDPPYGATGGAA